jgi:hypothetical protein
VHPYWIVKLCKVSRECLERVLQALSKQLNGDDGAARATRLMRVPNTVNWKRGGKGRLARVRFLSKTRYRLKDLEAHWKVAKDETAKQDRPHAPRYLKFFAAHLKGFNGSRSGIEAMALCPFHNDKRPSFSVNVDSGLWKCQSSRCRAKGNLKQFCKRLGIKTPLTDKIQRFPRIRVVAVGEEWDAEKAFREVHTYLTSQIHFTKEWQAVLVAVWAMGSYLYMQFPCYGYLWLNSPTTAR